MKNNLKSLCFLLIVSAFFSQTLFAKERPVSKNFESQSSVSQNKEYELYLGTYQSTGSCPLFVNGAVVEISYDDSILTRYENPKFATGLIIQSWWYPYKGYKDDVIRHERRYTLPMINVQGWYATSFAITAETMRYMITERPEQSSPLIVRKMTELQRSSSGALLMKSFYGYESPSVAERKKLACHLEPISREDFEKIKKSNAPYTSGDNQ